MTTSHDDWRLTSQTHQLFDGAVLTWKDYYRWSPSWDHDHCGLCWREFVPADEPTDDPDAVHAGYTMPGPPASPRPDYYWICQPCFADLAAVLGMTAAPPPPHDIRAR